MKKILLSAIILALPAALYASEPTPNDTLSADTTLYVPINRQSAAIGALDSTDFERRLIQDPTAALFKSMFIPGLGQIGNRCYVKAAVIIGLDAWFISAAVHFGRQANEFRSDYELSDDLTQRNVLYNLYVDRKDQRNKYTWFTVLVTFLSMFDAYVDAHLSGRPPDMNEKKNDLSFQVEPTAAGGVMAAARFSF